MSKTRRPGKKFEVTGEDLTPLLTLPLQSFAVRAQDAIGCPPPYIKDSKTVQNKIK